MLLLGRRPSERIFIGPVDSPTLVVTLIEIHRSEILLTVNGKTHQLRIGEHLDIGDRMAVKLLGIDRQTARLGIDAPRTVPIHREEVAVRVREEERIARDRRRPHHRAVIA